MMRPRRKRKLTNYGEGHLHWIEESQIHKALMKSLREKKCQFRESSEDAEESCADLNPTSSNKMPRLSVSISHSSDKEEESSYLDCSVNIENIRDKLSSNLRRLINTNTGKCDKVTRFQKIRTSKRMAETQKRDMLRNQFDDDQDCPPHATMMQSRKPEKSGSFNVKECSVTLSKKDMDKTEQSSLSSGVVISNNEDETSIQAPKARAQRKFASNVASPSKTKSSTTTRKREAQNLEPCLPQSDKKLPDTSEFLTFLCFRNTPLHEKLKLSQLSFGNVEKTNDD